MLLFGMSIPNRPTCSFSQENIDEVNLRNQIVVSYAELATAVQTAEMYLNTS